jgi:hypothetical protein
MHLRSAAGSVLAIVILIGIAGLAPAIADEFQEFQECPDCPVMVKLPAGRFQSVRDRQIRGHRRTIRSLRCSDRSRDQRRVHGIQPGSHVQDQRRLRLG